MEFHTNKINFRVSEKNLQFQVEAEGQTWVSSPQFTPCLRYEDGDIPLMSAAVRRFEAVHSGVGTGVSVHLEDFPAQASGLALELLMWVEEATQILRFEVIPLSEPSTEPKALYWPGPFQFGDGQATSISLLN